MNESAASAVIRLLHRGMSLSGNAVAEPWSLPEMAASPLSCEHALPAEHAWAPGARGSAAWLACPCPNLPAPLYITGPCTSSLDVAHALAEENCLPAWASVLSLSQTAGRGQMRRRWVSPAGNLHAAMRLPLEGPFCGFAAAPAMGALLAESLNRLGFAAALKWPNDLMHLPAQLAPGHRPGRNDAFKIGGILLEQRGDSLLAGIGINLASCPPDAEMRDEFAFSAGVLAPRRQNAKRGSRAASAPRPTENIFSLWARLAADMFSCYEKENSSGTWWIAPAERYLAFRGCRVLLSDAIPENNSLARTPCEGIIEGITPSGALLLSTECGQESFLGGSLIPAARS